MFKKQKKFYRYIYKMPFDGEDCIYVTESRNFGVRKWSQISYSYETPAETVMILAFIQ